MAFIKGKQVLLEKSKEKASALKHEALKNNFLNYLR